MTPPPVQLGHPRQHLRRTDSTNERARMLAIAGAPHGTLVTAGEQSAGRGRQGREWTAPPGTSLLCSLVLREPPKLLSLIAGVALCDALGARTRLKWPNDVVLERGCEKGKADAGVETTFAKLAGILVEGRPQEGWAVLGIGLNVAVRIEQLPPELRTRAASLELPTSAIEPTLERLLGALTLRLAEPTETVLQAWLARDALRGREVSWAPGGPGQRPEQSVRPPRGRGRAEGIDEAGRLIVVDADGQSTTLDAGEVHLECGG